MLSLTAFDTFNEAIRQSDYHSALADRASLARVSSDLVQLYIGNGKPYVRTYIDNHLQDPTLKAGFLKLATTQNATALVVNQIATTGLVRIVWVDRETGELDERAQGNWERLVNDWCSSDWDAYTQTVNRRTKLLRTVVASWAWDARRRRMVLSHYGPHQMDVGYDKGSFDKLNPDRYYFLREEATGWDECWEVGAAGRRHRNAADGITVEENAFPVQDPIREETVVPFVRFATGDSSEFWEWDGQGDQIDAHQLVDICWTTANVLREYGLVVVPLLMGDGWADPEGNIKPIIFDFLRPLKQPSDLLSGGDPSKPKLQFLSPSVESLIDRVLGLASAQIEMTSARYGVSARAVLSKGEAASGYALQIDGASQRRQHIADVARDARPWARVADGMRWYWNYNVPRQKAGWEIPANVRPVAIIPKSSAVVPTREGVDSTIAMVQAGMLSPLGPIYDAEPGIEAARAFAMAEAVEQRVGGGANLLDSMAAAGARAPQPNRFTQKPTQPAAGTEPAAAPGPVSPGTEGAAVPAPGEAP